MSLIILLPQAVIVILIVIALRSRPSSLGHTSGALGLATPSLE